MKTVVSYCEKEVIAYRCLYEECEDVPTSISCMYSELPDTLIVKYGDYKIFDKIYSLGQDGLYRFVYLGGVSRQVIVWEGKEIAHLISALSWITIHGNNDDALSLKEKYFKALHSKLVVTCGHAALWASDILRNEGIKNRIVSTLTLDEWNSYDNGHTMLEVWEENINKWVVYDIDNGISFSSGLNNMNILELCDAVCLNKWYRINYLSSAARYTAQSGVSLYMEMILSGETNLRRWFKRVLQVPLIKDVEGVYYFFDRVNRYRIEAYAKTYLYMDKEAFMDHFYAIEQKQKNFHTRKGES